MNDGPVAGIKPMDPGSTPAGIAFRIEQLGYSRWHRKVLTVVGTAHLFDSFDALLLAFVAPVLVVFWGLSPVEAGALFTAGYVGQLIGAITLSRVADKIGRLPTLRITLVILSLLSFGCGLAPSYFALLMLRFFQGLGLGGEAPVAATYLNEVCPSKSRGRIVFALQTLFTSGSLVAALASVWLIPEFGWRAMFFVGGFPLVLALFLPRLIPESPRWLAAQGRTEEAAVIMTAIERSIGKDAPQAYPPALAAFAGAGPASQHGGGGLLSRGYARRSISLWVIASCASLMGVGISNWMPTLYSSVYKLPIEEALRYSLATPIGGMVGSVLGFALIDLIGRRYTFLFGFGGAAIAMIVLSFLGTSATLPMVVALSTLSMVTTVILLCGVYVYAAEIYPTRMRASGSGATSACLRGAAAVGPLIVGTLLSNGTVATVFLFFGLSALAGAIAVYFFVIETVGRPLEETSRAAA